MFSGVGHEAPLAPPGRCFREERSQDITAPLASNRYDVVRHLTAMSSTDGWMVEAFNSTTESSHADCCKCSPHYCRSVVYDMKYYIFEEIRRT